MLYDRFSQIERDKTPPRVLIPAGEETDRVTHRSLASPDAAGFKCRASPGRHAPPGGSDRAQAVEHSGHAEEPVHHAVIAAVLHGNAGVPESGGIRLAFVANRVVFGGEHECRCPHPRGRLREAARHRGRRLTRDPERKGSRTTSSSPARARSRSRSRYATGCRRNSRLRARRGPEAQDVSVGHVHAAQRPQQGVHRRCRLPRQQSRRSLSPIASQPIRPQAQRGAGAPARGGSRLQPPSTGSALRVRGREDRGSQGSRSPSRLRGARRAPGSRHPLGGTCAHVRLPRRSPRSARPRREHRRG